MAITKLFSEVTIGGNHIDNPTNYNWKNYSNYPGIDPNLTYYRIDVITYNDEMQRDVQVTALAVVVGGHPMTGPTDLCIHPCPPFC